MRSLTRNRRKRKISQNLKNPAQKTAEIVNITKIGKGLRLAETKIVTLKVRLDATYPDGPAFTPVRSAAPLAADGFDLGAHLGGFRGEQGES